MTAAPPIVRNQRCGPTGLPLAPPASAVLAVAARRCRPSERHDSP